MKYFICAVLTFCVFIGIGNPAKAVVIDIGIQSYGSYNTVGISVHSPGDTGTVEFVTSNVRTVPYYTTFILQGMLAPTSMMTLTFNTTGDTDDYVSIDSSIFPVGYSYGRSAKKYIAANEDPWFTRQSISSNPLALISAQLDPNDISKASVQIINGTEEGFVFDAFYTLQFPAGVAVNAIASYEVSEVPLPAALPLFGLGLASLLGIGYRRKNKS